VKTLHLCARFAREREHQGHAQRVVVLARGVVYRVALRLARRLEPGESGPGQRGQKQADVNPARHQQMAQTKARRQSGAAQGHRDHRHRSRRRS